MVQNPVSVKLFGVLQGIFLVAVLIALFLHWKRQKERDKGTDFRFDATDDLRLSVKRTPVPPPFAKPQENKPIEIESAFPAWTNSTPAHEVLGVHPLADSAIIEAAYKKLLKKYHPDKYAHWGKGYQTRAHHTVLILQQARDKLFKAK